MPWRCLKKPKRSEKKQIDLFSAGSDTTRYLLTQRLKPNTGRYIDKDVITATYAQEVLENAYREIGGALDFYLGI